MIIDCRLRPPYKSFTNLHIYQPTVCNKTLPRMIDAWDTPSANEHSMELFIKELDEAGISKGVVMARAAANYAHAVPNEEIRDLLREYPGRFIGFGGVDLSAGIDAAQNGTCPLHNNHRRGHAFSRSQRLGLHYLRY